MKSRLARGPEDLGSQLLKAGPEVSSNALKVLGGILGCGVDLRAESLNFLLELSACVLDFGTGAFGLHPNLVCGPRELVTEVFQIVCDFLADRLA